MAAIQLLQSVHAQMPAAGTSLAATLQNATVNHSLLLAMLIGNNNSLAAVSSIVDAHGTAYPGFYGGVTGTRGYNLGSVGGAQSCTVTFSSSQPGADLWLQEWQGFGDSVAPVLPLIDAQPALLTSSNVAPPANTNPSGVLAQAYELAIITISKNISRANTAVAGWTTYDGAAEGGNAYSAIAYQIVNATTSITGTWNWASSTACNWSAGIFTLKGNAAPGLSPPVGSGRAFFSVKTTTQA